MPTITLVTTINAPIKRVFDLSRSIDLHQISQANAHEKAVGGRVSGLIQLHETVRWEARHLGRKWNLTSKITALDQPSYFVDEMVEGVFNRFRHEHIFKKSNEMVEMTDIFNYVAPFGLLGKVIDTIFLKRYMTNLLLERNVVIKGYAESDLWKSVLLNNQSVLLKC